MGFDQKSVMGLALCPQSHQMLSDGVTQDSGLVKPGGGIGSQVELAEHTCRYLAAEFET